MQIKNIEKTVILIKDYYRSDQMVQIGSDYVTTSLVYYYDLYLV